MILLSLRVSIFRFFLILPLSPPIAKNGVGNGGERAAFGPSPSGVKEGTFDAKRPRHFLGDAGKEDTEAVGCRVSHRQAPRPENETFDRV